MDEGELLQSPGAASEIAPLPPALSCVGEEDVELLPASASAADAGAALKTLSAASRADRVRAMTRDEAAVVLQARQRGLEEEYIRRMEAEVLEKLRAKKRAAEEAAAAAASDGN